VVASVFFSSDVANPDTYPHFYADLQMYTTGSDRPDPALWLQLWLSTEVAQKANKWQGRNICRWQNQEFDDTWNKSEAELDPVKRAELLIRCNDLVIQNFASIPVVYRPKVQAANQKLHSIPSGFDSDLWGLADWFKDA